MKTVVSFRGRLAAPMLLCAFGITDAHAQDPVQLHPEMFKILLEDEQVRVIDDLVPAGAKVQMHAMENMLCTR